VRELREEVGVNTEAHVLHSLTDYQINYDGVCFRYVSFVLVLENRPTLALKSDEIRKIEWVSVSNICKRNVVPFFWDTVVDLIQWSRSGTTQPRLFPTPQASRPRAYSSNATVTQSVLRIQKCSMRLSNDFSATQ
jgi:hypothetical protein